MARLLRRSGKDTKMGRSENRQNQKTMIEQFVTESVAEEVATQSVRNVVLAEHLDNTRRIADGSRTKPEDSFLGCH